MNANKIILNDEVLIDLTQDTATEEDVAKGKTFHKADGSMGVGTARGVELNIAYGDTAPEDTSKLWVKTSEPSGVIVSDNMEYRETSGYSLEETDVSTADIKLALTSHWVVGDKIYFFGGLSGSKNYSSSYKNTIIRYDTLTETFTTLSTTLPKAMAQIGVIGYGTKIYLVGGRTGNGASSGEKTILRFDTTDLTLTTTSATLNNTPGASIFHTFAIGTKAYVFSCSNTANAMTIVESFDAETEEVSQVTLLGLPTNAGVCCDGQRYIYFVGGTFNNIRRNAIKRIDTTDWTMADLKPKLITTVWVTSCVFTNNTICVFGGWKNTSTGGVTGNNSVQMIDIAEESTIEAEITFGFNGASFVELEGNVYIFFGGETTDFNNFSTAVYTFKPSGKECVLANGIMCIIPHSTENKTPLINTDTVKVEIGVDKVYKGNADGIGEDVEAALFKDGAWTTI